MCVIRLKIEVVLRSDKESTPINEKRMSKLVPHFSLIIIKMVCISECRDKECNTRVEECFSFCDKLHNDLSSLMRKT